MARKDLQVAPLEQELVVYDPVSGRAYLLNATGAMLWSRCDGTTTTEALGGALASQYGLDQEEAMEGVTNYLAQLSRVGLLAPPLR
nr:J540 [uncultured bacterium]